MEPHPYDAVVVVSFGGPETPEEVLPFLENVLRGKNVPRARMLEVAQHYHRFGGRSPIGPATRAMIAALEQELAAHGPHLPVYSGNRNWHPLLEDTLRAMAADGVRRALAVATSAFGSYSGCRQYLEDIERARQAVGSAAPAIDKIRLFYNHPIFIEIMAERVRGGWAQLSPGEQSQAQLLFTAHSIPRAMAASSPYEAQLQEACRLIAEACGVREFALAYQSRSGPPQQPWLEPSVEAALAEMRQQAATAVVMAPVGFLSDHMEVVYDLDVEAKQRCAELGLAMVRVKTAGDHPKFAGLLRELILERTAEGQARHAAGTLGAWGDACPDGCCPHC